MFYSLIETIWWFLQPSHWPTILKVGGGLSFVIFVHELGHFLVAKACGVRCDKFYVGFDVPIGRFFDWLLSLPVKLVNRQFAGVKFFQYFIPSSLVKFKAGETTYGIGIVPLGGYVKMLGQDDDPSQASAEMKILERQRKLEAAGQTVPEDERISEERARELLDPRSYQTKSVPQRLAIITAGVIMNVIFAFLMAVLAYSLGVDKTTTELRVLPGGAAWQSGLRTGDTVTNIAGEPVQYFDDLMAHVQFKNLDKPQDLPFVVKRPGEDQPVTVNLTPDTSQGAPAILVAAASSLKIGGVNPYGPYGEISHPELTDEQRPKDKDVIIKVNDQPITRHSEWEQAVLNQRDQPLKITVRRGGDKQTAGTDASTAKELTFVLEPQKKRSLGLIMTLGPIIAVQPDSPAAKAGLKVGQQLTQLNGAPLGDPETLEDRLRALAGKPVTLTVTDIAKEKSAPAEPRQIELTPRPAPHLVSVLNLATLPLETLGICCEIQPKIAEVVPGSPAEKATLKAGQAITEIQFTMPAKALPGKLFRHEGDVIPLAQNFEDKKKPTWLAVTELLQDLDPTRSVRLTVKDGDSTHKVEVSPIESVNEYSTDRGVDFYQVNELVNYSFGEAVSEGFKTTGEKLMMVVGFLRQIGSRISPKNLGGPVAIAQQAGMAANSGFSSLLLFLVMLSANLAVVNMLPIPVLDGGHVVFLLYEWITGKPMPANIFAVLMHIGLLLLMTLMLFVLGLDFGLISRR